MQMCLRESKTSVDNFQIFFIPQAVFYLPKFGELTTTDVYGSVIVRPDCIGVMEKENATGFEGTEWAKRSSMRRILSLFWDWRDCGSVKPIVRKNEGCFVPFFRKKDRF